MTTTCKEATLCFAAQVERFLLNNYQSRQLSTYALTLFRHNATVAGETVEIDFWDTAGQARDTPTRRVGSGLGAWRSPVLLLAGRGLGQGRGYDGVSAC